MNIIQLEQEIREYPEKLHAAFLHERLQDERVAIMRGEIAALEAGPDLEEDKQLLKLNKQLEQLRTRKYAAVIADPKAFGLTSTSTKVKIDIVISQDPDILALQRRIEERQEDLLTQVEEEEHQQLLESMRASLTTMEEEAWHAQLEREMLQKAMPHTYELLVQLATSQQ